MWKSLYALTLFCGISMAGEPPVFEFNQEDEIAARELKEHLEGMYSDLAESPFSGKHIRLGAKAGKADLKEVGPEGFRIRGNEKTLDVYGASPKGTLNGVYHFLEEVMGVRWLTPKDTYFPKLPQVKLSGLDICYKPVFQNRVMFNIFSQNKIWAQRQRVGHVMEQETLGIPQAHNTFYFLCLGLEKETGKKCTPEQAFKEHPEYFAEYVDWRGNRKRPFTFSQLCHSRPEVKRLVTKGMLSCLEKFPDLKFIDLSRMDGPNPCECKLCEAEYVKRGKRTNTKSDCWFTFFRDVAAEIHKTHPDILIGSLAYHTTQPPPDVYLGKNTCVRYCPIRMNYFCRVDEGEHNREGGLLNDNPPGLSDIAGQIKTWSTRTNLWLALTTMKIPAFLPNPNLRALGYNIAFAAKNGANSIFVEDLNWMPKHAQCALRSYILAKLLWNPFYDTEKGMREFCHLYYGEAGNDVVRYMNLIHDMDSWDYKADRKWMWSAKFIPVDMWTEKKPVGSTWNWFFEKPDPKKYYKIRFPLSCWSISPPLKDSFFPKAIAILADAKRKVENNPEFLDRVKTLELPVYFAAMAYLPANDPLVATAQKEFFPAIEKIIAGDSRLRNNPEKAESLIRHKTIKKYLDKRTGPPPEEAMKSKRHSFPQDFF